MRIDRALFFFIDFSFALLFYLTVTDFDGCYSQLETFFTFSFINYGGGASGNQYSSKSLIPGERLRLCLGKSVYSV